jgi:hypothetical protein
VTRSLSSSARLAAWILALAAVVGSVGIDFHVLLERRGAHEVGGELATTELRADCRHDPGRHVEAASSIERPGCVVAGFGSAPRAGVGAGRAVLPQPAPSRLGRATEPRLARAASARTLPPRGPPRG